MTRFLLLPLILATLAACGKAADPHQALYDEYHQIMCRDKAGERTTQDALRQAELNTLIQNAVAPEHKFPSDEARMQHMKRFAAAIDTATCVNKEKSPEEKEKNARLLQEMQAMVDEVHTISCKEKSQTATANERLHKIELSGAILKHELMTRDAQQWSAKSLKAGNPDDCGTTVEASKAPVAEPAANPAAAPQPSEPAAAPAGEKPAVSEVPKAAAAPAVAEANGPSFDCAKAAQPAERLICGNPDLARADLALSAAFKEARARAANPDALKAEQAQWLKSRRNACPDTPCMLAAMTARTAELKGN